MLYYLGEGCVFYVYDFKASKTLLEKSLPLVYHLNQLAHWQTFSCHGLSRI